MSKPDSELFGSLKLAYISNLKKVICGREKLHDRCRQSLMTCISGQWEYQYFYVTTDMEDCTHYVSDRNKRFLVT